MFRANNFDKLLDKATSNLRLDPDWPTILQICDLIRQNDCTPKYAVAGVKKKLYSTNPHQAMFALLTLESIVKNCGSGAHDEVTSKAFCEMLRDLVKTTQHENLRNKILELIQAWAFAFRNSPKYRAVQDTVNILKAEGYKFPVLKESDAMFSADTAPEWADGEVCHRCRTAFTLMVRRHHCRACGQVFCQLCSSKTSTLPKFGIEKEVRVCDACFDKVSRPPTSSAKLEIVDTSSDYGPTQPQKRPSTAPGGKTAEELQEEEELQLALALSQSEAEQKEKERKSRPHILPDPTPHPTVSPTPSSVSASPEHSNQANSELSRYLDRNYWESRLARDTTAPTAPAPGSQASNDTAELQDFAKQSSSKAQEDDTQDKEMDEFVETLKSQVEIFVNRMKSNSSRGRSIANDTAVQNLFMNITAMHSRLLKYIQQLDDKRVYLESLQDKVTQIRDSRAALDTLRAEHAARILAAAEAAERQRQMQMAVKLQAMRKKKHEYLQYQRQLALQRVQEQEREMQIRQEQQKHQYMMSANSYYMPGVSLQQYPQPGYPNQPIYANPQFQLPQTTDALPVSQPQSQTMGNQMATIAQSMPTLANNYIPSSATQPATQSISQNVRPNQMTPLMMQMHQMRLAAQPGMHQILQNIPNGQNVQQNGQLSKLPNQPPTSMMPQMQMGQNLGQQMINPNMMGMPMNMRMPMMQGQNQQMQGYPMSLQNAPGMQQSMSMPGQMPLPGQSMMQGQMPHNIPTSIAQIPQTQGQQMPQQQMTQQLPQMSQQPQQLSQQQQQMSQQQPHMSQPQPQMSQPQPQMSQPQTQMSQPQPQMSQPQPQMSQPQQMPPQTQQMPPQQNQMQPSQNQITGQMPGHMMMQQQIPNQIPQGNLSQGQIMNQMHQGHLTGNPSNQPQMGLPPNQQIGQLPPNQSQLGQLPQNQPQLGQLPPNQPQMGQLQNQPQPGQPMQGSMNSQIQQGPGQAMKLPQNMPGSMVNQQTQQPQTPIKSEHNNNTAELIRFD